MLTSATLAVFQRGDRREDFPLESTGFFSDLLLVWQGRGIILTLQNLSCTFTPRWVALFQPRARQQTRKVGLTSSFLP